MDNNKIAISGSSGFVGTELKRMFISQGFEVFPIPRSAFEDEKKLVEILDGVDTVINLSGANIIARWSEAYKKILYTSRINITRALVNAMEKCTKKPTRFISTSAVGIYDNKNTYDENDMNYSKDFLGNLVRDWEAEALNAKNLGIRTNIFRFGIVLGDGGALKKMLLPFKLGLGGVIGDGKQAFSFIHIEDLKNAYMYVMEHKNIDGIFNLSSPTPTSNAGLTKALGKALKRPTILPVPKFILKLIFSQGAQVLTDGQSVVPKRLLDNGFVFRYPTIDEAISNLVR